MVFREIKGVIKHSVIYGSGSILSKILAFALIPLYTHYLTPAEYGILELLELASYIIGLLLAMGLAQATTRFYFEYDDQNRRNQVIGVALICVWTASLITVFCLSIFSKQISLLVLKSADYSHLFRIVLFTLVFTLSNEICLNLILIQQKSVFYTSISLSRLLVALLLNIVFIVHFRMGIQGIIYSSLITSGGIGVFLLYRTVREVRLSFSFDIFIKMIKYSFPLIGSWLGMFVIHFGDRFLLQRLTSLTEVGIYSLAYKFGMVLNVLVLGPFMLIWSPKRFELAKQPNFNQMHNLMFTYLCFIQIFVGLGISILIKDVLKLVTTPQFYVAYKIVPLIVLSYIFWAGYSYLQFGVLLRNKTKFLALAVALGAFLNVFANLILIPKFRLWGAASATLISFLFLFVFIYFISQKLYYTPYQLSRLLKMLTAGLVLYLVASWINLTSIYVSLMVKFGITLCFPAILFLWRFFEPEELSRAKEIIMQAFSILTSYLGLKTRQKL